VKSATIDMVGRRIGRLVVIVRADQVPKFRGKAFWVCQCDCGRTVSVAGWSLRNQATRSCGCFHDERCAERATKHRLCKTGAYHSWAAAKTRCYNTNSADYAKYGGRGIVMHEPWRLSFEAFFADMGPRPEGSTIDRIDPNGPYAPGNCRWADRAEQGENKRSNRLLTHGGETLGVAEWERRLGFKPGVVKRRLLLGWEPERALTAALR